MTRIFGFIAAFFAAFCAGAAVSGARWQLILAAMCAALSVTCFAEDRKDRQREADEARRRAQRYE